MSEAGRLRLDLARPDGCVVAMAKNVVHDGFDEYQKYRRARTRRVVNMAGQLAVQENRAHAVKKFLHRLNIALSTRFLPEIAMHRIDWLYGYDCIRGFR